MVAITAIIVTYQSEACLDDCLESLSAQSGVHVEQVVVDNASAHSPEKIAHQYGAVFKPLPENRGFAAACNHGLQFISPETTHILFINPDVRLADPGLLAALVKRMQAMSGCVIASPRLVLSTKTGSPVRMDPACRRSFPNLWDGFCRASGLSALPLAKKWFGGYNLRHLPDSSDYPVPCVNGAFMLCDAGFVRSTGGFDEQFFMYMEDVDLCCEAAMRGHTTGYFGSLEAEHIKGHVSRRYSHAMLRQLFKSTRLWFAKRRFPQMNFFSRGLTRCGLCAWECLALMKNGLRFNKSARP